MKKRSLPALDMATTTKSYNSPLKLSFCVTLRLSKSYRYNTHHIIIIIRMKTSTMLSAALFAVSSSTAAAFGPKSSLAFRHGAGATRAFSRSTAAMMANPKGM
jgi:hypothetical protein